MEKTVEFQEDLDKIYNSIEHAQKEILKRKYRKNAIQNKHTENYLLLAKAFGTLTEIQNVEEIFKKYKAKGFISYKDNNYMYENFHHYYYELMK